MKAAMRFEELETTLHLPQKRYFTREEAEKLLPQIEEHLLEVQKLLDALHLLLSVELEFDDDFLSHAKNIRYTREYHKLYLAIYNHLDAIISFGCHVKDIEQGLVDFYAKKQDKDIFLCWKLGEKKIQHWHEMNNGFSGRREIEEL